MTAGWVTAPEALAMLRVKPQSLYASVSRGRIRTRPDPADSRRSLYARDDVERLARRAAGRRSAAVVASDAVRWGEPVLPSAVSTVRDGRLFYRGQDAAVLSRTASLEAVAALLWDGAWSGPAAGLPLRTSLDEMFATLAARAASDPPVLGRSRSVLVREAASVFSAIAGAGAPLHSRLAAQWNRPAAADGLRRALVLLADHELNASTFAARVAASTGASLAASTLAGLCTLSGPLHGAAALGVQSLCAAAAGEGAERAVRQWLEQGRPITGFGHRLYPEGDIRAVELQSAFEAPAGLAELAAVVETLVGERPNIDFALVALCQAFGLPKAAPLTVFALGRLVGWLAHALEQADSGELIRPRARYTGPAP